MMVFLLALLLTVYPNVVDQGGSVRVSCRVPKHADNRQVTLGLTNYTTSSRSLDGAHAPTNFTMTFQHLPCDPGPAFCLVQGVNGRYHMETANVLVSCF